jgi:hypothetical protein
MLGLPTSTEVRRQLPKKMLFAKFELKPSQRDSFDADVSRLDIVNWISPKTVPAIAEGTEVKEFYVVEVTLKHKEFDAHNIALVAKLIPQRILFALHYGDEIQLAIYHTKLFVGEWHGDDNDNLLSTNYNLDQVWEHIVASVGGVVVEQGNTLNEQIAVDECRAKIEKEIASLKRQMNATRQSKRKMELFDQIKKLEKNLNAQHNG